MQAMARGAAEMSTRSRWALALIAISAAITSLQFWTTPQHPWYEWTGYTVFVIAFGYLAFRLLRQRTAQH